MATTKDRDKAGIETSLPRGIGTVTAFLGLTIILEGGITYFFVSSGLKDTSAIAISVITFSPLFHFIPFGVIVVLLSTWIYLFKCAAKTSPKREARVPVKITKRRRLRSKVYGGRFKAIRRVFSTIQERLQKRGRIVTRRLARIGGRGRARTLSTTKEERFASRHVAIRTSATVLLLFIVSLYFVFLLISPRIYELVTAFYSTNQPLHHFILTTIEMGKGAAEAFSPVEGLASAVDNALRTAAPGFRNAIEGIGRPVFEPLANLELVWIYLICQNLAAWIPASIALLYGTNIGLRRKFKLR